MIFRRIAQSIRRQDWAVVLIELLVLVVGIYLGLQVDNWNQDRLAHANAKAYYARLMEDLRFEEMSRQKRVEYLEQVKAHGEAALYVLDSAGAEKGEQFLVDLYQASQIWHYSPQRTTYDELLSGSIANAIPDEDVRAALANYYVGLSNSQLIQQERVAYRERLRTHMPHAVQSAIRENCGDIYEFVGGAMSTISLPESCELGLSQEAVDNAIASLADYRELRQDLTRNLADLEVKLRNLNSFLGPTREIGSMLREKPL